MKRLAKSTLLTAAFALVSTPAAAASKPLINYFLPMPIVGKLSTTVWGASTVGARDPSNGLEDNGASGGVGAQQETYFYWDGKILLGNDGKYHMYASHWPHSVGFGPPGGGSTGWEKSIPMQAISDNVMGPYVSQGNCYTKNEAGNDMGHNVTALVTPTGTSPYTLSVGEIVPGQMFNSSSPNGPWNLMGGTQTTSSGHSGCGDLSSNFTFTVGGDKRFWATSRGGCVMDSDQIIGPYKVETNSILPNLEKNDNGNAEDETIWFSGGYYHIVYNYWNVQRGYHIMSKDGISNWTSTGLAYQARQTPSNSNSNWLRYTDGTVNQWDNMERVGVYQDAKGHVTHFTFAVTDVPKNGSGVSNGGSKVLVVPFNGVQFDCDNGDSASCTEISTDGGTPSDPVYDAGTGASSGAAGQTGSDSNGPDATAPNGASGSDMTGNGITASSGVSGLSGGVTSGSVAPASGSDAPANSGAASGTDVASGSGSETGGNSTSGAGAGGGSGSLSANTGSASGGGSNDQSSASNGGGGCATAGTASSRSFAWLGGVLLAGAWIKRRRPGRTERAARATAAH